MEALTHPKPQARSYACATLNQAARVMNLEWSPHDISALSSGSGNAHIRVRDLAPDVSIGRLAFGAAIRIQPRARADVLLLQMPLHGSATVRFADNEVELHAGAWGLVHARTVQYADCSADYDALVLRLPMQLLKAKLEGMWGSPVRKPLVFDPAVRCGSASWESWAPFHAALARAASSEFPHFAESVLASLVDATAGALLTGMPNNYSEELARPRPPLAPRHVRRAEEYMQAKAHEELTSGDIARHVGVSVRTLFDGFVAFRSITPAQALRQIRLDGARQDLLQGASTVTEVAARWGCHHGGRFASSYRRRFKESPAQTLRNAREA